MTPDRRQWPDICRDGCVRENIRVRKVLEHARAVFDTEAQAMAWLSLPNQARCSDTPLALLDTDAGARAVDSVLTRLEYGVFA